MFSPACVHMQIYNCSCVDAVVGDDDDDGDEHEHDDDSHQHVDVETVS